MTQPTSNPAYQYPNVDAPLTPNRICLRGKGWQGDEYLADVAGIMPGMLLAVQADGSVIPHPAAGGQAENIIALEDALQGAVIQQAYTVGSPVMTANGIEGDIFYMLVNSGAGTWTIGSGATSDGAGGVKKATGSNFVVGVFKDAMAVSPSVQTWTRVRIGG